MFYSKNFWEQQGEPQPPVVPPRPMTDEEKRVALIQELVAASQSNEPPPALSNNWNMRMPMPNNMLGPKPGVTMPNPTASKPVSKFIGPDFASKIKTGMDLGADLGIGHVGDSVGSGAKGLLDGIAGIAQSVIAAAPENRGPESIEDLYARLQGQYGGVGYSGPSGDEMAKEEFDPQFAILKQIADEQKNRYNTGKGEIAGLYASLVNAAGQDRTANKKMYDEATGQINKNYAAASGNVSGNVQASNAATAELLKTLGQDQAIGKVSGDANAEAAKQLGYLAADQQNSADTNTQLGANQYAYNTAGIANTRQAGANSQQDLLQQYLDAQTQNDLKRLDLTGAQTQAGNQYDLQIQKMLQDAQGSNQGFIQDMVSQIMQDRQNQTDTQFKQAGMDLDLAKFGLDQDRFNASQSQYQNSQMDPFSALQQRAAGLYGNPGQASQASQQILNVYKNNPNVKSIGDFLRAFVDEGNNLDPATQTLASYFITQILKNQPRQ